MNIQQEPSTIDKKLDDGSSCCTKSANDLRNTDQITEKMNINDLNHCESSSICTLDEKIPDETADNVSVTVIFGAEKYEMKVCLNETVLKFRSRVETLTGVPADMQKLICKGSKLVEDSTLQACKITDGSKIMLIGTRLKDIIHTGDLPVVSDMKEEVVEGQSAYSLFSIDEGSLFSVSSKEPLCRQKIHAKVLEKGIPEDVMPGIKGESDPLPDFPISGMLNKRGGKVRLTFKLESDQVWIGTKERTDKIPMNQIKHVISEPIEFHEEYHIMRNRKTRDMGFAYYFKIVDILESSPELKKTFVGITKQVGCAAGGCAVGGIVAGPPGALVGSFIGALIGYISCNEYDALVIVIRKLSDEEKHRLEEKVQTLVGTTLLEDLTKFVQDEVNRQLFLSAVTEMFKSDSDTANDSNDANDRVNDKEKVERY